MKLRDISALGRPLEPAYPSNVFIMVAFGLALIIESALRLHAGISAQSAIADGVRFGLQVFLAWAIAREIDPDSTTAAGAAAVIAFALSFMGTGSFLAALTLLLALRIAIDSTGVAAMWPDVLVCLVLVVLAAPRDAGWPAALGLIFASWLDAELRKQPMRRLLAFLYLAAAAVAVVACGYENRWQPPSVLQWGIAAAGAIAGVVLLNTPPPASKTDYTHTLIPGRRLMYGRMAALVTFVVMAIAGGREGIAAGGPVVAALAGSAVTRGLLRKKHFMLSRPIRNQ